MLIGFWLYGCVWLWNFYVQLSELICIRAMNLRIYAGSIHIIYGQLTHQIKNPFGVAKINGVNWNEPSAHQLLSTQNRFIIIKNTFSLNNGCTMRHKPFLYILKMSNSLQHPCKRAYKIYTSMNRHQPIYFISINYFIARPLN